MVDFSIYGEREGRGGEKERGGEIKIDIRLKNRVFCNVDRKIVLAVANCLPTKRTYGIKAKKIVAWCFDPSSFSRRLNDNTTNINITGILM